MHMTDLNEVYCVISAWASSPSNPHLACLHGYAVVTRHQCKSMILVVWQVCNIFAWWWWVN